MATKKTAPSWSDVKARLADFDRVGLVGLVQDLYAASKDNQAFLHTRFAQTHLTRAAQRYLKDTCKTS